MGLHPDIIPEVGKLLIEASKRSQIFVTTHSDILVDALSEVPEAVVVCEKVDGATKLRRLDGETLKAVAEGVSAWGALDEWEVRRESVVRTKIYVEGGGRKAVDRQCRRAFNEFFRRARIETANVSVEARGPRGEAYNAFCSDTDRDLRKVLLVDAEGPVTAKTAWGHLQQGRWSRPAGAKDEQCHLMVQVMESWFLADVDALEGYYGQGFRSGSLPKNPDVEKVPKKDVERRLKFASRDTGKGEYKKGRDSFAILERLDPAKVRAASRHADRFVKALL